MLRASAVAALLGSATVHAVVVDEHLAEWVVAGAFFGVLAAAEAILALAIAVRPSRSRYAAAVALSLATAAVWLLSRTVGVPVGPEAWEREPVGSADAVATLLELATAAVLTPLLGARAAPWAPAATSVLAVLAVAGATAFALAQGTAGHDDDVHDGAEPAPIDVPAPRAVGGFSPGDAARARRCAARLRHAPSARPRARTAIVARDLCFDHATLTLTAGRPVVVRVVNRERRRAVSRAHTVSIYAFSAIPQRHRPVLIGTPVRPGATRTERFEAPPPGSYFFQCDIHRFMRGVVVFR